MIVFIPICGFLFFNIQKINGQHSLGCPLGWDLNTDTCYLFESNERRIFEEADSACLVKGASLLIINSQQEHKFISAWLMIHDLQEPLPWFTSGTYKTDYVSWDRDTHSDQNAPTFWADNTPPAQGTVYTRVAYVRRSDKLLGYGWRVVSPSLPSNYICELPKADVLETQILGRNFTYGLGNVAVKDVPMAPHILTQPDTLLVLDTVPSLHIECIADGNPYPSYRWRKNGRDFNEVTSSNHTRHTLSAGRFTIHTPNSTVDEAEYQCVSSNRYGVVLSNPAKIVFGYLQSFSPVRPHDVSANKFEGTRISCNQPAYFPEAAYMWFMYDTSQPIFYGHPNMFISSSGYLYFSEVQPTDQRQYFCVVTLTTNSQYQSRVGMQQSRSGPKFWLIVTGIEHGNFQPFIYTHIVPSAALRGSRIKIECIAYGSLPLYYEWHREDGRSFDKGTTLSDRNRVLTIENTQISAEGNYICTVKGRAGMTSQRVTVTIEAKPYFAFEIGDRFVDLGQTLKWRCKAVARPEATYTWYKNGVTLISTPGKVEIQRNYLCIHNVQANVDEGMYQCAATNVYGTTFSSGQLKVLSFKPTFAREPLPPITYIPQGGNYVIRCRVEAAPLPDVVWLKNGAQLSLTPGETTGHLGMTVYNDLVFNLIDKAQDEGMYNCKASNINGEATNQTIVEVVAGISIYIKPTDTTVRVNSTVFFYCQASYDTMKFDLTYVWKLNGHIIDFTLDPFFLMSTKDGLDGLYIRSAQFEHTGIYTCEALTTMHNANSSAKLVVQGPPGTPAGVHVRTPLINNTAMVIWTVTSEMNHGSPINRYVIEAELGLYPGKWTVMATDVYENYAVMQANELGLRSDQRMATVSDLLPNMSYNFRVIATNDFGRGEEAGVTKEQIKTDSMHPVTVPKNIRGKQDGKVGTLNVLWDPLDPSEYAGDGVGYYVYFKKKGDPNEWFKATVTGGLNSSFTHLVGEQNFYMPYAVMVAAFNKLGNGPNSSVFEIMSAEEMPIATVTLGDCYNYNESAFSIQWTPVDDTREVMKGRLKGYRIRYWRKYDPNYIIWRDVYGQADHAIIIGLEHNTIYTASVQVMNFAGVGPIGEERFGETWHMAPIDYPRFVKVYPHTMSSVLVTWQGIATIHSAEEETLEGYIIRVWKVQEDIRSAVDTKIEKEEEAIVENLQSKSVYVLRVLGYSRGGNGTLSQHVYFTIEGGSILFDPTTTYICNDHLQCTDSATTVQPCLIVACLFILFTLAFQEKNMF